MTKCKNASLKDEEFTCFQCDGNAVTPPVMQMIIERCMATFGKVS